jgi:CTP synthase (UTP-ammonia lyase)
MILANLDEEEYDMTQKLKVGIVADWNPEFRPHQVVNEVLQHAAQSLGIQVETIWLPTELLDEKPAEMKFRECDAIWGGPGSPYKSLSGALNGIRFARENDYPFIGTCAGFQHVVVEYARNVLGVKNATSAEYDSSASQLLVSPLACSLAGKTFQINVKRDTRAHQIYQQETITEHYYCNYGLNPQFQTEIQNVGLLISGIDETNEARILELPKHRFFIATLFVPQLFTNGSDPHPLIAAYLKAAIAFQIEKRFLKVS